jgi:hypothetical protein
VLDEAAKERMRFLCDQIAREQDRDRFSKLVSELNQLLESAEVRSPQDGKARFSMPAQEPS